MALDIDVKELQEVLEQEEKEDKAGYERLFKTSYPTIYLYGTGELTLKVLWSMKDKNIQQNIDFHTVLVKSKRQGGGTFTKKVPCNKVYEEECELCDLVTSQPDLENVKQKSGGILYAILVKAERETKGENKGKLKINIGRSEDDQIKEGDLVIIRYPFFVRQKFRELMTENIDKVTEIFASNESYLVDLTPDPEADYVMNVSLNPHGKDKQFATEEEYEELLKSLPSLKTQFFDRTDPELKETAQELIKKEAEFQRKAFRKSMGTTSNDDSKNEAEETADAPECFGQYDEDSLKCSICAHSDKCEESKNN